jgi:hypothetical protein
VLLGVLAKAGRLSRRVEFIETLSKPKSRYTQSGHTPALAGGARELRFFKGGKAQFVTVGII